MKSFSRSANHIGIDMGSSQTRIFSENRLLLDERTVVAVDWVRYRCDYPLS